MSDDDKISKLPIRFKPPLPPERTLVRAWEVGRVPTCEHTMTTYLVGPEGDPDLTCGRCGGKVDPLFVIRQLATHDRRYAEAQARYQEEQKRLEARSRTKCEHCKQMTRISRR